MIFDFHYAVISIEPSFSGESF